MRTCGPSAAATTRTGDPAGPVALVLQDVTEARRVEAVRRDFVANVGHELKTPVGALALLAEAIVGAADDPEAVLATDRDVEGLGPGGGAGAVDRLGDHPVDLDGHQFGQRLAALQPGQVDQLADEPAQPVGLARDPSREPLHRLGVVGRLLDRLGEQRQGADRRLELVPDVGHEVPAHGLGPPGLGDVLQDERDRPWWRGRPAVEADAVDADQPGS